jgi:hypothetical protein
MCIGYNKTLNMNVSKKHTQMQGCGSEMISFGSDSGFDF